MISLFVLSGVEICIILAVVAAGIIALSVMPSGRGPAQEYLVGSTLCRVDAEGAREQALDMECREDGTVAVTRRGLSEVPVKADGALSLKVTVRGFDIEIEERIVGGTEGENADAALLTLDFLALERYHIRYRSEPAGRFAAFVLPVRPGMSLTKALGRG